MEVTQDTTICSECGAKLRNGKSCQDYFDVSLTKDLVTPSLEP